MYQILPNDDGYTVPVFIRGKDRMYGDARLRFRPVSTSEWAEFAGKNPSSLSDRVRYNAVGLAKSIVSWDLKDENGNVAPINVDTMLRVHRDLFMRMVDIVILAAEGGDPDPEEVGSLTKETEPLDDPFGRKARSPLDAVREQQGN